MANTPVQHVAHEATLGGGPLMALEQSTIMAALLCMCLACIPPGGHDTQRAAKWPERAIPAQPHRVEPRLFTVQNGPSSYMEGRGFQSYRRERGFVGERQFGAYPKKPAEKRDQPGAHLKRRRLYGPSDNRCAEWSRRCDLRTGENNRGYDNCMRYHGCR